MIDVDHVYSPGERTWFEYHCWESHQSADAHLWLRSHQQVTVVEVQDPDDLLTTMPSFVERMEAAMPITYTVAFDDGTTGCATEDELVSSPAAFVRPAPPTVTNS